MPNGTIVFGDAVSAALAPGWSAWRRSRIVATGLFLLGWGLPLAVAGYAAGQRRTWVALTLDAEFLRLVVVAGVAAVAARLVAVGEVWWAHGRPGWSNRRAVSGLAVVSLVVAGLAYGTLAVEQARAALAPVFSGQLDVPLFTSGTVPGGPVDTVAGTSATEPDDGEYSSGTKHAEPPVVAAPAVQPGCSTSGVDPATHPDVSTILLLGGDAGPGRWSLRTDTMMLFSIHRPSGRSSLVSIPRNLMRLQFPTGSAMQQQFPDGFTDLANAVYPVVQSRTELRDAYSELPGTEPGVAALAEGIGCSLGVTIDDYVLVDMRGFVDLVDALGGVTVDVPRAVPMPGNIPGAPTRYPSVIGPGEVFMDGTTALGYVRSRSADSDYRRTERQRQLLAALAQQVDAGKVVRSFGDIATALGDSMRTSLTPDELADTLEVIGGDTAIVESVGLIPPVVDVNRPDWPQLARIVAEVQVALVTGLPSGH